MRKVKLLMGIISIFLFNLVSTQLFAQNCSRGISADSLDSNNTKSNLRTNGLLMSPIANPGEQNVESGLLLRDHSAKPTKDISAILASSLWIGGTDADGNLRLSAEDLGSGAAFWPGPVLDVDSTGYSISPADCRSWDKIFKVSKFAIETHISNIANGIDDIPDEIAGWPGNGNPLFESIHGFIYGHANQGLAPYVDVNQDAVYNPEDGDYPDIENADEAAWWVINTIGGENNLNVEAVFVEMQIIALTYDSHDLNLDNTVFYEVRIINRMFKSLENTFFSLWITPRLGCGDDDYVGCLPEEDLAFIYNQDAVDGTSGNFCVDSSDVFTGNIPLVGIPLYEGPFAPKIVNEQNELVDPPLGVFPDTLVRLGMTSFTAYGAFDNPNTPNEFYNLMQGSKKDGSPQVTEGVESPFAYAGNPNMPDSTGWVSCLGDTFIGSIRMMMNMGPIRYDPGQVNRIRFAVTGVQDVDLPCPEITPLVEIIDSLNVVNDNEQSTNTATSTTSLFVPQVEEAQLLPNPVQNIARLVLKDGKNINNVRQVDIYNAAGALQLSIQNVDNSDLLLDFHELHPGIYFYKVNTTEGQLYAGKFVKIGE